MIITIALAVFLQDAPLIGPPILYQPCPQDPGGEEIVVCGDPDAQSPLRLSPPAPDNDPAMTRAVVQLSEGVDLSAEAEGAQVGGQQSNRAMIRLKIAF